MTTKQVPIVGSVAMLYYKHVRKLSMRLRNLDSEAQAFAQARLANVRTVRAFANETMEAQRFQQVRLSLVLESTQAVPVVSVCSSCFGIHSGRERLSARKISFLHRRQSCQQRA